MASEFVTAAGTRFSLGGTPFPVSGVNCYFLGYCSDASRRAIMAAARGMGANVIRSWAFLDGEPPSQGQVVFQYFDGTSIVPNPGPDGLERLDALVAAAEETGFRLVLPFINYWKDFGGIPQYMTWLGIEGGPEKFFTDGRARGAYRRWVQTLLTRRNTRTGRVYADEPAVMAWELANEPRCEVAGGRELVLDWVGEMSAFVKSLDRNHLLAVGDEGFLLHAQTKDPLYNGSHGVDGEAILNFGEIDFGTYHFYPEHMNGPAFAETWIRDHVASGTRANKPMLLEEYGLTLGDGTNPEKRLEWYARWTQWLGEAGGAGALLWMLGGTADDVTGFRDSYTVYSAAEVPPLRPQPMEAKAAAEAARPALGGDQAAIEIALTNVDGASISVAPEELVFLRGGRQMEFDVDEGTGAFVVNAGVKETWSAQVSPARYRTSSSGFFFLAPGDVRPVSQMMARDRSAWTASFRKWDELGADHQPLKDLLLRPGDVQLFPEVRSLGMLTGATYDGLGGDALLPKTAMLNLYYKLRTVPDPIRPELSWFSHLSRLLEIGRERLIAIADAAVVDSVKRVLENPAQFGYHRAEDPELHRKFLPAEFREEARIFSIKASVREASLQITVSEIPSRDLTIIDADLDEHGDLLELIFDGIAHIFDGGTHPYDIHEFLIGHAAAADTPIDLGYTLV
jgi:mannan endo-1,4-beta-mannosidase